MPICLRARPRVCAPDGTVAGGWCRAKVLAWGGRGGRGQQPIRAHLRARHPLRAVTSTSTSTSTRGLAGRLRS
nr:MAG TPA: hypothetical protein [Caudoviricetes sp.]